MCARASLSLGISNVSTLFFVSGGPFAGLVRAPPRFSGPNCRVQLFNYRVRGPAAAPSSLRGLYTPGQNASTFVRQENTYRYPASTHKSSRERIREQRPGFGRRGRRTTPREDSLIGAAPRRATPLAGPSRSIFEIGTEISIRDIEIFRLRAYRTAPRLIRTRFRSGPRRPVLASRRSDRRFDSRRVPGKIIADQRQTSIPFLSAVPDERLLQR